MSLFAMAMTTEAMLQLQQLRSDAVLPL